MLNIINLNDETDTMENFHDNWFEGIEGLRSGQNNLNPNEMTFLGKSLTVTFNFKSKMWR